MPCFIKFKKSYANEISNLCWVGINLINLFVMTSKSDVKFNERLNLSTL